MRVQGGDIKDVGVAGKKNDVVLVTLNPDAHSAKRVLKIFPDDPDVAAALVYSTRLHVVAGGGSTAVKRWSHYEGRALATAHRGGGSSNSLLSAYNQQSKRSPGLGSKGLGAAGRGSSSRARGLLKAAVNG